MRHTAILRSVTIDRRWTDSDFGRVDTGKITCKVDRIISGKLLHSRRDVSVCLTLDSALYVVDLVRFRELSAGDRLRGQYQSLSMDPNSLANLDQDLPNNMIHQVPIHSLPQEWLYCETWCAKENLARAKTIDMCNDPMTKEPKLQRARRMVPEWNIFDKEIQDLHQRWKDGELGNATVPQEGGDVAKEDGRKDEL